MTEFYQQYHLAITVIIKISLGARPFTVASAVPCSRRVQQSFNLPV